MCVVCRGHVRRQEYFPATTYNTSDVTSGPIVAFLRHGAQRYLYDNGLTSIPEGIFQDLPFLDYL